MSTPRAAFVLAAGEGRRLRPFTESVPKPLLPLLNVPLLTHTLAGLARAGVERAWVNAWHLAQQIEAHVDQLDLPGLSVSVVVEDELLGTGGGLANLWHRSGLDEPVLAVVADVVADFDYRALGLAHRRAGALATMALTRRADPQVFGPVEIDAAGELTDIVGLVGRPGIEALVNASAHIFEPAFLQALPREPSCFVRQGYVPALRRGALCAGWIHAGPWHETGRPEALLEAQIASLRGELPVDPGLLETAGWQGAGRALVHPSALVADDAELDALTVVGAEAVIGSGARLAGCLVLPGSRVPAGAHIVRRIVAAAPGGAPSVALGDELA